VILCWILAGLLGLCGVAAITGLIILIIIASDRFPRVCERLTQLGMIVLIVVILAAAFRPLACHLLGVK
jgi:multisubunit Na+/H+ antiporter MnhB subunit